MELAEALKLVINDITNDPTWLEKPKKKTLRMLNQRLMELETIWAIPDELWNAEFEEVELPDPEQPDENKGSNRVGEMYGDND